MKTRILLVSVNAVFALSCHPEGAFDEASGSITLPPLFEDHPVANLEKPTAIAFLPDGRILVSRQRGQLHIIDGGGLRATPSLDLSSRLCDNSERGLLGIAVDPRFSSNRFVYLYYKICFVDITSN